MARRHVNMDVPTVPIQEQRARILNLLLRVLGNSPVGPGQAVSMSSMGYAAFPENRFNSPQGAALAVCKTVKHMQNDGLLLSDTSGFGYQLTRKGLEVAQSMD